MSFSLVFDTLLEASFRVTVIAGLIAFVLAAFRVKSPATKHAAWAGVMMTMLALPGISGWVPKIPVPGWMPDLPIALSRQPETQEAQSSPTWDSGLDAAPQRRRTARASIPQSSTGAAVSVRSGPAAVQKSRDWREMVMLTWLVVAGVLLLRELIGWQRVHRLAREGVPTSVGDGTYQSDRVMTPVVTGVLRPRVMVPSSWPQWGDGVRQMVLGHERAHVGRRDPIFAAIARINRAVFWFHPLSWWMERHLSRLAERACDDIVIRTMKEPRLYAALLVEMAHRLRHQGCRVEWQGIGIVSSRRFEERVDLILEGPAPQLSLKAKLGLLATCAALVVVGVGCETAAAPLAEDPKVAKDLAATAARFAEYEEARALTVEQVEALEKEAASNPDDLSLTSKLLMFYQQRGQKLMGWERMSSARRALVLRVIERHPESGLGRWPVSRRVDPKGYEQARALWLKHVERADASQTVLGQAASFFEQSEKPLAEQVLLRAQAADPTGPTPRLSTSGVYRLPWSRHLGALYAMAMVGSDGQSMWERVTTPNLEQAKGPFATEARKKLDASNDPQLLLAAGDFLTSNARDAAVGFDAQALGLAYASKALALDPVSIEAQRIVRQPDHNAEYDLMLKRLGKPAYQLDDSAFQQLPVQMQLEYGRDYLSSPYGLAAMSYRAGNPDGVQAAYAQLKRRAEFIQRSLDNPAGSTVPPDLPMQIHVALGTVAMHRGDRREAVRLLGLAASSMRSGASDLISPMGADKLAYDLLDAGERETVAAYFVAVSKVSASDWKGTYEQAAGAIRAGRMPVMYQRYKSRGQ